MERNVSDFQAVISPNQNMSSKGRISVNGALEVSILLYDSRRDHRLNLPFVSEDTPVCA